ncbi:hypothetical protein G7066_12820 [Leucobacter coleopterorum]|uniref:Right handed beta helix region n=1 Tax=Leucobacter coleopterorum TaxID=2714933 RepID=A0ABX6JZ91_9MICO|nr:hypothetical protein [Leucobacter coleopterorum]QIM19231.1 hypothetical protein G7066_12820 [Leucobacter coleopterorum]
MSSNLGAHGEFVAKGSLRSWWRDRRVRLAAAVVSVLAMLIGSLVWANSAQAATHTFVVDSFDTNSNARSANPSSGVCKSVSGKCTLRAAVEASNALNLPKGQVLITVANDLVGNIDPENSAGSRMNNSRVSTYDAGAHFEVTAPVTIDLKNQVTIQSSVNSITTIFYVNGPDVELRNMTQILSGRTSFVAGSNAHNMTIDGGTTITDKNYYPESFLAVREGASNITVKNYRMQGYYPSSSLFYIDNYSNNSNAPIENLVIDNVDITYTVGGNCNAWDGSGCRTNILGFSRHNQTTELKGFTFKNSLISNLTTQTAFPFNSRGSYNTSVRVSDINISGNDFINVQGTGSAWYQAFISLPFGPIPGTNLINNNNIVRAAGGQPYAVSWVVTRLLASLQVAEHCRLRTTTSTGTTQTRSI